jgi:DNA-directed RNA polymerase subunit L
MEYKLLNYVTELENSRLEIKISGKNIDNTIINSIRRGVYKYVPIYAFTNFNIKKNNTLLNNDQLKLQITNIPVWKIVNNHEIYIPVEKKEEEEVLDDTGIQAKMENDDNVDLETETSLVQSTLNQLTMYVDFANEGKEKVIVTTDDAKFYFGEKNIDSPYKIPIPIIELLPSQSINFSVMSELNTRYHSDDAIFSPVSVCYFEEVKENDFIFIIESKGQISEQRIIEVAIKNIINKLESVNKLIQEKEFSDDNISEVYFVNEDHTLGNLLAEGLKKSDKIDFASYCMPHYLDNKIKIEYKIKEKFKIKKVFDEIIINYISIFQQIIKKNIELFKKK